LRKSSRPEQIALRFDGDALLVAGVDEAGRGPLAGPVVAAAVILDDQKRIRGLAEPAPIADDFVTDMGRSAMEDDDLVPQLLQRPRHVRTNEAGAANQKDTHHKNLTAATLGNLPYARPGPDTANRSGPR